MRRLTLHTNVAGGTSCLPSACKAAGQAASDHFRGVTKIIGLGIGVQHND